jgi:hypothetical protein
MQEIFFLARHVPFWAVPFMVLGLEFAYLFWLRKKKILVAFYLMIALIGLLATIFYVWAGGPERSVRYIKKLHRDHQASAQ